MNRMLRKTTVTAGVLSLAVHAVSHAQGAAPPANEQQYEGLTEIVVTAQRREANMQSVPVAVTSIDASVAQAIGIKNVTDVQVAAPAINWGTGIGGANISIRGLAGTGSAGDESANAVYVDGVYNPVGASLLFGFNNIARIEIDKGPQGTLFGRNALGGAVQIFTKDPEHQPSLDASIGYDNYQTLEAQTYVTGGLSDTLAADLALFYADQQEGWGRNVNTGEDAYLGRNWAVRSKWKWTPSDATTVTAIYSHNNIQPTVLNGGTQVLPGENKPYVGFYNVQTNFVTSQKAIQDSLSLNVRHELSWATIANIASYEYVDQPLHIDADFSSAFGVHSGPGYETWAKAWTEEFQVLSPASSSVDWVAGFYYLHLVNFRNQRLQGRAFGVGTPPSIGTRASTGRSPADSYAGYAQATWPVFGDNTRITTGLRYTIDERSIEGSASQNGVLLATVDEDHTDKKLTWRASIDHDLTDTVLLFASATRGFKSGFYNISNPTNPVVKPQVVDAYELGIKSELFDRVRLNVSAFYNDFSNIQVRRNIVTGPIFENAAEGRIQGLDIDFQAQPLRNLEIQGGLTYLDSEYTDYSTAQYFAINPAGGIAVLPTLQDAGGNTMIRSPEWVASIGGSYEISLAGAGMLTLAANYYYNDGFFFDPQNRIAQPQYELVSASATWAPSDNWSVMFWGKNLTDERYFTQVDITFPTGDNYFPAAPRTYGATVRMRF